MKKIIILLLFTGQAWAQNLVPNGGFETISSCPQGLGNDLQLASPWQMPANMGVASTDLFNTCNTFLFGVPLNVIGYQPAHLGNGYAGIYCYGSEWREYLQVQLSSSLSAGVAYAVNMYVSPGESQGIGIDAIGIHFSTGPVSGTGSFAALPFIPQVSNSALSIISDTLNWTHISGIYQATGGEDYITIGNFLSDVNTNTLSISSSVNQKGYYRVDDVSVTAANVSGMNGLIKEESFKIYPSPFKDELKVECNYPGTYDFLLYDVSSKLIWHHKFTDVLSLNSISLEKGIYYYELKGADHVLRGKLFREE